MNALDSNALANIFIKLGVVFIINCSEVCKKFKRVIDTPFVWNYLLNKKYDKKYKDVFGLKLDKDVYKKCYGIEYVIKYFKLSGSIEEIYNLTCLNLGNRNISSIPESFGNLVNLTQLWLYNNKISSIPESFGNLVNLTYLSLYNNEISSIPESFGNLVNLTYLYLDNNKISSTPESFGNLVNLTFLSLSNNKISSIPESVKRLKPKCIIYL